MFRRTRFLVALSAAVALSACGDDAASAPGAARASAAFGTDAAAGVLAQFDAADSAASQAGDLDGLRAQEVAPALDGSIAAVHRARHHQRRQPGFRHVRPTFAIPTGDARCFLAGASLEITGDQLTSSDVSQFVRLPDGRWRLSHNVQVTRDNVGRLDGLGGAPAVPTTTAVGERSRQALTSEVFARSIGAPSVGPSLVATSQVLDRQLAAGWRIYGQQLATGKLTVARALDGAEWSECAARVGPATVAFLVLRATDTVTAAPGGPSQVVLRPDTPDLIATGNRDEVRGRSVTVSRVEVFLLLIPDAEGSPATVLGLSDTPTAVRSAQ